MSTSPMDTQERQYAALAPILAIAGMFAHPMASVLLPLGLFFIFYFLHKNNASLVALRSADLAFSIQLCIIIASLLVILLLSITSLTEQAARTAMTGVTLALLVYMAISQTTAAIMVFRGRIFQHWFSFRIGERLLNTLGRNKD